MPVPTPIVHKNISVYKDTFVNVASLPDASGNGQFMALFTPSYNSEELIFLENSSSAYLQNINPLPVSDSHFENLLYSASINDNVAPNKSTKEPLSGILNFLQTKKINYTSCNSLAEGGFAIDFKHKNKRYLIEVYNDNEDVFTIIEPGQPIKAWDLNHSKILKQLNSAF